MSPLTVPNSKTVVTAVSAYRCTSPLTENTWTRSASAQRVKSTSPEAEPASMSLPAKSPEIVPLVVESVSFSA